MSEKLFILCQDDLGNYEIRYDEEVLHFLWEVAPILNEQQATIDQLNLAIDDLLSHTSCDEIKKENEQLRKTMNEVIELLVEEVDLFSDKATEHDIIAYKEMNDFDNKDAYYMCISTKKAIKMLQRCL